MNRRPWLVIMIAFVIAVSAIGWGRSLFRPHDVLQAKWEQFMARKDDVDLLFVGSSEVFNGIDPATFDQKLAAAGTRIKSFNLGVPRLNMLEQRELVLKIIREKPPRLKYLFLQPLLDTFVNYRTTPPAHLAEFHSWAQLLTATRVIRSSHQALSEKLRLIGGHALGFTHNLLNVGHLSPANLHVGGDVLEKMRTHSQSGELTFEGLDSQWVAKSGDDFARQKAQFESVKPSFQWGFAAEIDFLQSMADAAHAAGIQTYFVGLPTTRPERFFPVAQAVRLGRIRQPFLGFNDPIAQSELNAIGLRWRGQHLNLEGSKRFSRMLADQFTALRH